MKRPWLAFVLSLLLPGLGQVYAAAPLRGLAVSAVTTLVLPSLWLALLARLSTSPAGIGFALTLLPAIPVLIGLDAAAVAVRWRPRSAPRRRGLTSLAVLLVIALPVFAVPAVAPLMPFRSFRIPSGSMTPNLLPGDFIVADMRESATSELARGDVLVYLPPVSQTLYAHRLIGKPGDVVELRDRELWVNGERRSEPLYETEAGASAESLERLDGRAYRVLPGEGTRGSYGPTTVPDDAILMLGDQRAFASDSREWGFVPLDDVRGRVLRVIVSFEPRLPGQSGWLPRLRKERMAFDPAPTNGS